MRGAFGFLVGMPWNTHGRAPSMQQIPAHGPAWPAKGLPLYMFDLHFSLFQQQCPFFPVDINFHFYDLGFEFFLDFLQACYTQYKKPSHKKLEFFALG
jgi:hypothetical protein